MFVSPSNPHVARRHMTLALRGGWSGSLSNLTSRHSAGRSRRNLPPRHLMSEGYPFRPLPKSEKVFVRGTGLPTVPIRKVVEEAEQMVEGLWTYLAPEVLTDEIPVKAVVL